MSTAAFDTLKFTDDLIAAGVDPAQARAQAKATNEAFTNALDAQVATKADVAEIKAKVDVIMWVVGVNLAFTVILVGVLALLLS